MSKSTPQRKHTDQTSADGIAELRMLILGQAGTGKTKLIKAMTETFRHYDRLDIPAKCATTVTGIAAVDIGPRHSTHRQAYPIAYQKTTTAFKGIGRETPSKLPEEGIFDC